MAAVNYMRIAESLEHFKKVDCEAKESVQLLIRDEHDERFTLYTTKL